MPVLFKPVLPKPVKDAAMKAVLVDQLRLYSPKIKLDFDKTISGWKMERPKFVVKLNSSSAQMSLSYSMTGSKKAKDVWGYLNYGTKPHMIYPKRYTRLRFRSGAYKAGSAPGRLATYKSSPAKGPFVLAKKVHHPGFPARDWLVLIKKKHEKPFGSWMKKAMSYAAKASGHEFKGGTR